VLDDGTQHTAAAISTSLVLEQVGLDLALECRPPSSGDQIVVGSRFQVLGPYTAKLRWPVDVRVQSSRMSSETAERD